MALTKITNSLVAINAIQGTLIADNAVTAVHIVNNAITATQLADNAVTATKIQNGIIATDHLAADLITAAKIADDAISEEHLDVTVISSLSAVTANSSDYVMIGDASDSNNLKKVLVSDLQQTDEEIADIVGAMVSSNTESGITVAYEDGDNTLDFTVGTLNQDTTGSAATLTTARTIAMTGDVVWSSGSFDGSGNVTAASTIQTDAVDIAMLSATGTASSSTYLRGDNSWAAAGAYFDTAITINDSGADVDFRVESNNNANMLFVDGGNDNVGIGTATPNESGYGGDTSVLSVQGASADNFGVLELITPDVTSANRLGEITFGNLDGGSSFACTSRMRATRDGADNSSALSLWTTNAGTLTERITIKSDGKVGIGVADPDCKLEVGGTDAMSVPSGTTAQRPTARNGMMRYNSTNAEMEAYEDGEWAKLQTTTTIRYRYARYRVSTSLISHHPRFARVWVTDSNGNKYNVNVATSDNCNDEGTVPSDGTSYSHDLGSGNLAIWTGIGLYSSYEGGDRSATVYLDGSNDNSSWTAIGSVAARTQAQCGELDFTVS